MQFHLLSTGFWPNVRKDVKFYQTLYILILILSWNLHFSFTVQKTKIHAILCFKVSFLQFLFQWRDTAKCYINATGSIYAVLLLKKKKMASGNPWEYYQQDVRLVIPHSVPHKLSTVINKFCTDSSTLSWENIWFEFINHSQLCMHVTASILQRAACPSLTLWHN